MTSPPQSIAHHSGTRIKDGQQVTPSQTNMTSFSHKATLCPNCKKPLPRCAVCLLYLGTSNQQLNGDKACEEGRREAAYDRWFNFCLSCSHGTHAGHARDWFSKHTQCPVPDCTCESRPAQHLWGTLLMAA